MEPFADRKESLKFKELEHVLIEKVINFFGTCSNAAHFTIEATAFPVGSPAAKAKVCGRAGLRSRQGRRGREVDAPSGHRRNVHSLELSANMAPPLLLLQNISLTSAASRPGGGRSFRLGGRSVCALSAQRIGQIDL